MKKNSIFAIVSVFLLIGLDQLVKFLITSHMALSDTGKTYLAISCYTACTDIPRILLY